MNTDLLNKIEKDYLKEVPEIRVGDTVKVNIFITEKGKTRTQVFEGLVISIKGSGLRKMITVRKISNGYGVEKILPLYSPAIEKWEVVKHEKVRRSKLYYMRERIGKAAVRIKKGKSKE